MWRYQQPGFALRLLCELQKQQQCSLHCDALLQTEGVSIPAHSCVLSALSPIFCRAFANAPSLQVGQSRLVQLEAVGAQALMKLVGFMYSGEMQGESLDEQREVIDIAHRLGFSNFMEGKQKQVNRNQNITASWMEIGLQTVETRGRKKDASVQILSEKRSFSHSGTQTDRAQAHFADTCFMSEPELSVDLPNKITGVSSEYNSMSPDTGLAWIDDIVAHSPSNSTKALVRMHTKHQQTQKEKKRGKILNEQGGTQISLKIKMKRQRSGELWEIVSVREESTVEESKSCGSSDDPLTTHSLAETHKSSEEVQLSPSSSLTCQNLETVTLTPPAELTTHLSDETTRSPTEHHSHPDPIPLSSRLQMPHLSPALAHPKSDEQFSTLLEMVTKGLNILPSVTTEENSSMYAHLDQNLKKCATVASLPTSYLCLPHHNLGTIESRTSDASQQLEAGSDDLSSCRKSNLMNVASEASYPKFSYTSPRGRQRNDIESSFTPPCPTVPARLNFITKGLEHQNVAEFKTILNNCLERADTYAQSGKQTVSDAGEVCNMQNKISRTDTSNAAQDDPTSVGNLCQEQPCVTDHMSVWQSSDVVHPHDSAHSVDFSEMRLPRCLSPLTSDAADVSVQDSLKLLEFSLASHVNLKPALRHTSSCQLQAFPGKTNQQNSACTSQLVKQLHCPVLGKNSCPLRLNEDHNGEANLCKSEKTKTKERNFENDLGRSTAQQSVQAANEPCRKKAKIAGYTNETDTQTTKVNPCSVNMKNIRNIESIQDISNPGTSEGLNRLKAPKARKTVSIGLKSQENLEQMSHSIKCKDQEACQKDVWDSKQIVSLVANHGHGRLLQERVCAKGQMEDLSKIRKFNSLSVNPNAASSSFHHDFQLTQMSKECVPRHGNESPPEVQHDLGLAQADVRDSISECEKKKEPGPENKSSILEPEKVFPNVNLGREENEQPQRYSSLFNKTGFCDKIFHQTAFSVGTSLTESSLPINHQVRSILQTTDRKIRTSLPPSLICKKMHETPKHYLMSTRQMMDNKKEERKDTLEENEMERREPEINKLDEDLEKNKDKKVDPKGDIEQTESSSKNINGCLMNVNFVRGTEISANTNLSILNANSHLQICPPARDLNSNGMENNLQNELPTTLLHPFRTANMMEKPKTDKHITEGLSEVPVSNKPTEDKLIKTKEMYLEGTESTQIVNLGRQEKGTKNTVRNTEHVEISKMNEYEPGLSDIEVDVMDESAELATCHGGHVVEGMLDDSDVEESQMDNDGEPVAHEEEFIEQQIQRTEVMPPEEVNITSNMITNERSFIQHGEEPVTSSLDSLSSSVMFVPDVNTESAEDCSSADEELVVDDFTDFSIEPCTGLGTQCKTILEEENELEEEGKEEEDDDVDVTGEESN